MRMLFKYIVLSLVIVSCGKQPAQKPIWLNQQPIVTYPGLQLHFKASHTNWHATLLSFVQPIALSIQYQQDGFVVNAPDTGGLITGPMQLCLHNGEDYFYYSLQVVNKASDVVTKKDYRSPKTVNPDSSLHHQQLVHYIDQYQNIVLAQGNTAYFFEASIQVSPKAASYRAIATEPLSAYYVQPGSCVSIPIQSMYNSQKNNYVVTAGPLADAYQNKVADGTAVAFTYKEGVTMYRMEVAARDGFAVANIPANNTGRITVNASIHKTASATIQLNH